MRNSIDFSSWQGVLSTLLGLIVVSLVAVGIRLLVMHSVQQRRERQNRQINERLKTLIAAYKTLGSSFTGDLAVDPSHRRDQRAPAAVEPLTDPSADMAAEAGATPAERPGADRRRRIRDAVEAALSDVILLGTEEQVRLASAAARDMVAGRPIETDALVVSLRTFIRDVLDLEAIPTEMAVPRQGPLRSSGAAGRGGAARGGADGSRGSGRGGGGGAGGAGAGGEIGGIGLGAAAMSHRPSPKAPEGPPDHVEP